MNVLDARSVSFSYGDAPVLRDVTLSLAGGELAGIVGPNGAGKSTLLKLLAGFARPSAGTIALSGKPLAEWRRVELARRVAYVPQAAPADVTFTALEVALAGRHPHVGWLGFESRRDLDVARSALARLDAAHLADRRLCELSGGEQARVLVARALAQEPELLLLDEPTAFLDLQHQAQVLERVRARVRTGLAAVAVLHDPNLATAFTDAALLLRDGRVLGQGVSSELLDAERLGALYGLDLLEARTDTGHRLFAPRGAS